MNRLSQLPKVRGDADCSLTRHITLGFVELMLFRQNKISTLFSFLL